jgi:hypothetical protein
VPVRTPLCEQRDERRTARRLLLPVQWCVCECDVCVCVVSNDNEGRHYSQSGAVDGVLDLCVHPTRKEG